MLIIFTIVIVALVLTRRAEKKPVGFFTWYFGAVCALSWIGPWWFLVAGGLLAVPIYLARLLYARLRPAAEVASRPGETTDERRLPH